MTPPAEHVQIDLAEHPTPAAPTVTLPEDAKSGDVYEDPATGMRYAVRAVPSGGLRAFAISPGE